MLCRVNSSLWLISTAGGEISGEIQKISESFRIPLGRFCGWLQTEYFIWEHQSLLIPSTLI